MTKIITIARVKDEEHCIEKFCSSYQWADKILLADDDSFDNTVALAEKFPNVEVRFFSSPVQVNAGYRTGQGKQINFIIQWAKDEKADWIIFDDADCTPNYLLKEKARQTLEAYFGEYVLVTRLYLWRANQHFPKMAKPRDNDWTPGLWAWRGDLDFWAKEDYPTQHRFTIAFEKDGECLNLFPPFCLLHDPWPTDEIMHRKLSFYQSIGRDIQHPLTWASPLAALPEWARE